MNETPIGLLFSILAGLIVLSGFFSSSETAMMSLNRYRLKHLAKSGHHGAKMTSRLLERPDRLIGIILIGNNLVNIGAASIATIIALRLLGDIGPAVAPFVLTIVVLIFAEVTPKTIAALHPEKVAFPAAYVLKPLLILLHPFVAIINFISNGLARLFGVDPKKRPQDALSSEELRTVVDEASDQIPENHQGMLLNILDLEKNTVNDIMIPRNEVIGLDLDNDIDTILKQLRFSAYTRIPVYRGDINDVTGILHLRNAAKFMSKGEAHVTKQDIIEHCRAPYFIPESTPLHTQLVHFQQEKRRIALVVDEYGEVQGIVTLEDLLEEIVGDFTTNLAEDEADIIEQEDGSFLIEGATYIREINRELDWELPTDGPKTLNGLITEQLEIIPEANVSIAIDNYHIETREIEDKLIKWVRVRNIQKLDANETDE